MQARMSSGMLAVLRATPEMPDVLMRRVAEATPDGEDHLVNLSGDEAIAMVEMCQWYIRSDPENGDLTKRGRLFDAIVAAIDEADLDE
jgi:hypothetical protein